MTKVVFLDAATMADTDLSMLQSADTSLTLYDRTDAAQLLSHASGAQVLISNKVALDAKAIAALPELRCWPSLSLLATIMIVLHQKNENGNEYALACGLERGLRKHSISIMEVEVSSISHAAALP